MKNSLFYRRRRDKKYNSESRHQSAQQTARPFTATLMSTLMPSIIGICLCIVCFMSGTYAWFTASQITHAQSIVAAEYNATAVVQAAEAEIQPQDGAYTLEPGTYTVTLTSAGSASTGYCVVQLNDMEQHTQQIPSEHDDTTPFTFTLVVNQAATMTITPWWGTSTASEETKIAADSTYTYGEPSPVEATSGEADNNEQPPEGDSEPQDEQTDPSADPAENDTQSQEELVQPTEESAETEGKTDQHVDSEQQDPAPSD